MVGRIIWNTTLFGIGGMFTHQNMIGNVEAASILAAMFVGCVVADCIDKQRGL